MFDYTNLGAKGGDKDFKTEDVRGIHEDKGIVIGIVKVNSHPTHMGVLSVFIPQYGNTGTQTGKPLEETTSQWRQVRYATPFYSRSEARDGTKSVGGIVYPCPDIGTRVLCVFPEGRNAEGFWFACAPDAYMMQTLPESGMTSNFVSEGSDGPRHTRAPALDLNDRIEDTSKLTNWLKPKRKIDLDSFSSLKKQGLDKDEFRGLTTSNYMRETPSELVGITTKGRRKSKTGVDISKTPVISSLKNNPATKLVGDDLNTLLGKSGRARGHSLTMDDGDIEGNNNQVRIRTSHGHQILLHDTEDFIYISNSSGTSWIQMDKKGQLDLYSETNVNVRSKNINFHADQNIKFHAKSTIQLVSENTTHLEGGTLIDVFSGKGSARMFGSKGIDIKSGSAANIESSGTMNLKAGPSLNVKAGCIALQGSAAGAAKGKAIPLATLKDTMIDGKGFWNANNELKTTVDRAPTHEPYIEHGITTQPTVFNGDINKTVSFPKNPPVVSDDGLDSILEGANSEKINEAVLVNQSLPDPLGVLDANNMRSISAGISELVGSNGKYNHVDSVTRAIGKFGLTTQTLKEQGFIKPEAVFNGQLSDPRIWTGKNGVGDLDDFFANSFLQEDIFQKDLAKKYQELATNGGIKATDAPNVVSAMLTASYASGSDYAKKLRAGEFLEPKPIPGTTVIESSQDLYKKLSTYAQKGASAYEQSRENFDYFARQGLYI